MKTKNKEQKRQYAKPEITKVEIDNQISMVMMSTPPDDPYSENIQDNMTKDPYKINRG